MKNRKKRDKSPRPQLVQAGPSQWWVLIGGLALLVAIAMLLLALPRNGVQSRLAAPAEAAESQIGLQDEE